MQKFELFSFCFTCFTGLSAALTKMEGVCTIKSMAVNNKMLILTQLFKAFVTEADVNKALSD